MENQISDTESVDSSNAGSFTKCLKVPTRSIEQEQSLKVVWVCDKWSRYDSKEDACTLCKHDISFCGNMTHLERKHTTTCLIDFHGANIRRNFIIYINIVISYCDIFQVIGDSSFTWWYTSLVCIHVFVWVCVCGCVCMYLCVRACICVCMYVCALLYCHKLAYMLCTWYG